MTFASASRSAARTAARAEQQRQPAQFGQHLAHLTGVHRQHSQARVAQHFDPDAAESDSQYRAEARIHGDACQDLDPASAHRRDKDLVPAVMGFRGGDHLVVAGPDGLVT